MCGTGFYHKSLQLCRNAAAPGASRQELVDLLIASLGVTGALVTTAERDELRSLLAAMGLPDRGLAGLNVEG